MNTINMDHKKDNINKIYSKYLATPIDPYNKPSLLG